MGCRQPGYPFSGPPRGRLLLVRLGCCVNAVVETHALWQPQMGLLPDTRAACISVVLFQRERSSMNSIDWGYQDRNGSGCFRVTALWHPLGRQLATAHYFMAPSYAYFYVDAVWKATGASVDRNLDTSSRVNNRFGKSHGKTTWTSSHELE